MTEELNLAKRKPVKKSRNKDLITLDGKEFDTSNTSQDFKDMVVSLNFVNEQILQKNNELQIADSARIMYLSVLKAERTVDQ